MNKQNQAAPATPAPIASSYRGSRECCLTLTDGTKAQVAARLTKLVAPHAIVGAHHKWMPRGHSHPAEAKLGECADFLTQQQRAILTAWWLKEQRGANTPNWDLVSQATIGEQEGLILVEAKAHEHELSAGGKPLATNASPNSRSNHQCIADAIQGANTALNSIMPGWDLKHGSHYQLANRFAWLWKVASLGVPVILVYLGCIEVNDMPRTKLITDESHWERVVLAYSKNIVPVMAWQQTLMVPSQVTPGAVAPLRALIRTL